jgi:hypothetical protein
MFRMSENAKVYPLSALAGVAGEPFSYDVGGTTAETAWVSMKDFDRIFAYVEIGTWNATDDLDHCRLEQAQDSSGTGAKDLTTDASGGNYDTANPVDADGNFVIVEARAEDLDVDGGFTHVRFLVGEDGNTGVDTVGGFMMLYNYAYPMKELQGAATTGEKVYVRPTP